jgi:hypothetical protein
MNSHRQGVSYGFYFWYGQKSLMPDMLFLSKEKLNNNHTYDEWKKQQKKHDNH